ncbi:MAG TPA: hypothetical protein P5254_06875, partial [Aquihabitans sp.]|nr:hypothetical protein [Aquihabitans sp.]
ILGAHQVPIVDTEVIPTPSTDEQRAKVSATVEFDDEEKATGELTSPGTLVVGDGSGPAATLEIPGSDGEAAEGGDDAPEPAPDCGRPPAAPSSRVDDEDVRDRYGAGTTVGLETVDGLRVEGEDRLFCPRASECGEDDRRSVDLPAGTLLYDAPSATLRLDEPAVRMADAQLLRGCGRSACRRLDPPSYLTGILQGVGGVVLLAGIAGVLTFRSPGGGLRLERLIRLGATAWLAFATAFWLAPHLAVLASNRWARLEGGLSAATGFGVAAYLTAIATQVAPLLRQGDAKEGAASAPVEAAKRLVRRARPYLLAFVGAIVGPLLLAAVLLGAAAVPVHSGRTTPDQLRFWLALLGPLSLILIGGDLNSWSLHSFYRARLQSAFAVDRSAMRRLEPGADRPAPGPDPLPREDPLASLVDADPELLVCAAVNLADDRATAPGRPVASWVFSPTQVGSATLGGARGFVAPGDLPTPHLGSAWTAVAVSGAAFSPAMGKMSRPERSILAIANLRLGLWYPNPLYLSDGSGWFESHRNPRPWYLAKEMIGLHRASDRWVYVSDGGHYENLGLVELLRSGCREIYCFDAAGDTTDTFGTFSDAARLARAELGVEIELEPRPLEPGEDGLARTGVVAGWFRVPADGDRPEAVGWIVLAKLVIPRTAPHDIADLARTVPGFPTNPTSDQLFTDQKFEAYRALGDHLGTQAAEAGRILRAMLSNVGTDPDRVRDAVRAVNKKLQGAEEAPAPQAVALSGELALRQAPS